MSASLKKRCPQAHHQQHNPNNDDQQHLMEIGDACPKGRRRSLKAHAPRLRPPAGGLAWDRRKTGGKGSKEEWRTGFRMSFRHDAPDPLW